MTFLELFDYYSNVPLSEYDIQVLEMAERQFEKLMDDNLKLFMSSGIFKDENK